mgnify:CR=1 FL=1
MVERYRGHLIFAKAYLDRSRGVWTTSLHVQFNEDPRTFSRRLSTVANWSIYEKTSAEKHALEEAKQWVNDRLL